MLNTRKEKSNQEGSKGTTNYKFSYPWTKQSN